MSKKKSPRNNPSESPIQKTQFMDPQQLLQQAVACYGRQEWLAAERLCRQVLQIAPQQFDALHLLGAIALQSQRFEEALELLRRAHDLQPDNPAILNKLGIVCTHLQQTEAALAWFRAALELAPFMVEALVGRAALHASINRHGDAIEDYRAAIRLQPGFALAHFLLGNSLAASDEPQAALECYDEALRLVPSFVDALHARGNTLREAGRPDEAVRSYEQALAFAPRHFSALSSLADLLVDLKRFDEGLLILDKVLNLKPDFEEGLYIRGKVKFLKADYELALRDFTRVLAINPNRVTAHLAVGNIHHVLGRFPQALASYDQALRIKPDSAQALLNRSEALRNLDRIDEALECNEKAVSLAPDLSEALRNLGHLQLGQRQLKEATESFRKLCEIKPELEDVHSSLLFTMNYRADVPPEAVLAEARRWAARHASPLYSSQFVHGPLANPSRPLRLGYVSSDFVQHAVAHFMAPILEHHDKERFEVYCYHCNPQADQRTRQLSRAAAHWIDASKLSADELAQRIHADGIDVLIDLAGHTAGNRLRTFARKPAPVQITYLGYPGTTGMQAMDYRITDLHADPAGADPRYVETLLRLPHSLWCYQAGSELPAVGPSPASLRGHLTLGSFNNFNKIDRRSLELWAKLLQAVPTARLVVATVPTGQARTEFLAELRSLGVDASRIDLLGKLPMAEFWQRIGQVDLSLDPVSVNGATTTCESLLMGVPVISRVGSRFLERAGLSILTTAGLPDFACETDDACVRLVQALDADRSRLAALRSGLRAAVQQTTLIDGRAFTRSFEQLLRGAWERAVRESKEPVRAE